MHSRLPRQRIVLLGIGHTNAHVLRMWKMKPLPDTELVCVSNFPFTTYSGMLSGVLAGQYSTERMQIDLVRLAAAARARLILDEVTGLDPHELTLQFANRPPLPFDCLSIGIGSIPSQAGVQEIDDTALPIKPMQTFIPRLAQRVAQITELRGESEPLRIAVVGGGAGGAEIALCLPRQLQHLFPQLTFQLTLVHAGDRLVPGSGPRLARRVEAELRERGVQLRMPESVTAVQDGTLEFESGGHQAVDLAIWATGAAAPPLLEQLELPVDRAGFLRTDDTLRTIAELPVFAVGDCGTMENEDVPKAGVYAVRQAPVLWQNLQRTLASRPLKRFNPQRSFLKILNLGNGRAVGEYKGVTFHGGWVWRWKDLIDRRFMDKYQNYSPMPMRTASISPARETPRCAGCGGKVGGGVLSRVLERLDIPPHPNVLVGLEAPDDAAVVRASGSHPLTVTTDFFVPPLDDPYLSGRIAALHAASDVHALGAQPFAALAIATIPPGHEAAQEEFLHALLAGGLRELKAMGATLVGGHTIEGDQPTIGYTVLADQGETPPYTKAGLKAGDRLILTKPLGTGVLLAAHMRGRCRAEWYQELVRTMLISNQPILELQNEFSLSGVTDVTGFGLAGHLLEMLQASGVSADLAIHRLPLLPGTDACLADGIESTLVPANLASEASIDNIPGLSPRAPHYRVLFDPQTSGGMLIGVRPNEEADVQRWLREAGLGAATIGSVSGYSDVPRIRLR